MHFTTEMSLRPAQPVDRPAIENLLAAEHLPTSDLDDGMLETFIVAEKEGQPVGTVGLEIKGQYAVLRSLVVAKDWQGRGLGARLIDAVEREAAEQGITVLYLLTETAATFFERIGYTLRNREAVPAAIAGTEQFAMLCPASAICLGKQLSSDE